MEKEKRSFFVIKENIKGAYCNFNFTTPSYKSFIPTYNARDATLFKTREKAREYIKDNILDHFIKFFYNRRNK